MRTYVYTKRAALMNFEFFGFRAKLVVYVTYNTPITLTFKF